MKNTNKTNVTKALHHLIDELKQSSEDMSESDFDRFLMSEIIPVLIEDKQLFGASVFSKLRLALILNRSELKNRSYSFERAITKMDEKAVCWILEHIWASNEVIRILEHVKKGNPIDDFYDLDTPLESLQLDTEKLQKWLNNDLFDRIQLYRNEIKAHKKTA